MSIERHYFPGNNTPLGFFSYYKYIIGQREANKIVCVKGGPGTGKSTFMKKIGDSFLQKGEDVDFLHCSADENSLDGILLRNKKIAVIDGTSPHIIDPVTPGAVDKILNLGEFWNEEGIAANKDEIIDLNEKCTRWYRISYNYLNAAKSVYRSLQEVYNRAIEYSEIYRVVADVVHREFERYQISMRPGKEKKFFASAITGSGCVNYIPSLLSGLERIYIISAPSGYLNDSFMNIVREGAIYRGFEVESFYCPMCPEDKLEHIIIPDLKIGFLTVNDYHDIEPWEILYDEFNNETDKQDIILLDVSDYMDGLTIVENKGLIETLEEEFDILLNKAIQGLANAREAHMRVENMYIPNMNFTRINAKFDEILHELTGSET